MLYAQPIVDLRSGEVVQHELLLRMREADGDISARARSCPRRAYGLIGEIDRWVIGRAAEIAATGRPVEVNLSAHRSATPASSTTSSTASRDAGRPLA